jgi:RNA polymerase sigma-70 factor (ECF subfamily)
MKHELLVAATRGDRAAIDEVVRGSWRDIRRICFLQLLDRDRAEEAAQEAALKLVRFLHRFDPSRDYGRWMRTLVRNVCRDVAAKRTLEPSELEPTAPTPRLDRAVDLSRAAARARAALEALPPRQRELMEMVDRRGLTAAEAARELGLSPSAVRGQLSAARRTLRAQLLAADPSVLELVKGAR